MAHPLSLLGIAHTAISLVPVAAGLYGFARYRTIEPATGSGKVYLAGLALSVFTSFGLSSTGGFNPGHALGILALLAAFGSLLAPRLSFLGRLRPYLATFGRSFSFFLLLVPAINETLTRLPPAHPLADGPQSPLVRSTLLAWVVIFIVGFALQVWTIRSCHQDTAYK
ncbi:MAG: hypothetical protein PW790_03320 [Parvibaculaceae bacterium]|nr:hypothetical protein [Parvibaculaceae bacterium]